MVHIIPHNTLQIGKLLSMKPCLPNGYDKINRVHLNIHILATQVAIKHTPVLGEL